MHAYFLVAKYSFCFEDIMLSTNLLSTIFTGKWKKNALCGHCIRNSTCLPLQNSEKMLCSVVGNTVLFMLYSLQIVGSWSSSS